MTDAAAPCAQRAAPCAQPAALGAKPTALHSQSTALCAPACNPVYTGALLEGFWLPDGVWEPVASIADLHALDGKHGKHG